MLYASWARIGKPGTGMRAAKKAVPDIGIVCDVTDDDARNRRLGGLLGVQVHTGPPMTVQFKDITLKDLKDQ